MMSNVLDAFRKLFFIPKEIGVNGNFINVYVLRKLVRFFLIKNPCFNYFYIQFNIQLSSEIAISINVS